ncbi:MAG: ABC transporter substrate-binding protein [Calothrix sp. C42_A2020_038]|nr:ABC transporter substrate-binding protein [Calothrix sp. C42_A2020_038]
MKNYWIVSSIGFLLIFNVVACQNLTTQQVTQTTNSTQIPLASVKRVVALTSLSADIIYQLDSSKLVGITGSSLLNKNPKFKDITRVSEGQTPPNLEKIVALKPDLVIGAEGFSNQTIEKLKQLGIPTLLTSVNSVDSLTELTKNLAQKINADPQPLLKRYQSFIDTNIKPDASTLVLVSRQPILSPNKSSWAGNLLEKFNVKNITANLQGQSPIRGYITLSPEKVLEANPNIIILVNPPQGGSEQSTVESFQQESFWSKLEATKNNRVYVFDYYGLINAGTIDAIEKACKQLKDIFDQSA